MSKKNGITLKIAVLSIAFVTMANSFISPALAQIGSAFPQASATDIQLIMTFAMVGSFPLTLITGGLANRFRSKAIVVVATVAMLVGGFLPLFLHNHLIYLYLSAILMGAGQGALMTMMSTLATELFEPTERSRMFGLQTSISNGGNMLMVIVAGVLANIYWSHVYFTSLLMIPTLIFVLLWLPRGRDPRAASLDEIDHPEIAPVKKGGIAASAWPVGIFILLFSIGMATNVLNSSMLMNETGMGGSAATGILMSLASLVGISSGFIYKQIFGFAKQYVLALACLCEVVGLFIAGNANTIIVYFIGAAFISVGFTLGFSGGMDCMSRVVPVEKAAGSMGLYMAGQSLGGMISPYIINTIAQTVTGRITARHAYLTASAFVAVVLVIAVIWGVSHHKYFAKQAV